jgi:hypothetical protein
MSAVKRFEFVSGRVSYIILRGYWFRIVLDVYTLTESKIDNVKGSFYKDLECVFL